MITEDTTLTIACDNPACPAAGDPTKLPSGLVPGTRRGWIMITWEVYEAPTQSGVFCSPACASAYANVHAAAVTATQVSVTSV